MKTNQLKMLLAGVCALVSIQVQAQDFGGKNGGDVLELKFKTISSDIQNWIDKGGALALSLPAKVTLHSYEEKMKLAISSYNISFVSEKIVVNGAEKQCENIPVKKLIRCNIDRFPKTETDQYVLVHHEFAGIAGFENNIGVKSDYSISKQITKSLEKVTVLRLVVKSAIGSLADLPSTKHGYDNSRADRCIPNQLHSEFLIAACLGKIDQVNEYINSGGDLNIQSRDWFYKGDSALIIAVRENHVEIVKLLIANKANLDLQNKDKETALYTSVDNENVEIVNLLITAGANLNLTSRGRTPLSKATAMGRYDIADMLLKAGTKLNVGSSPLMEAVIHINVDAAKIFIRAGANVNYRDQFGDTSLMYTIRNQRFDPIKNLEMIKMLIAAGTDLELQGGYHPDQNMPTALIDAASIGDLVVVKLLVEAGANIYAEDGDGLDAIGRATKNGHADVVEYLKSIYQ